MHKIKKGFNGFNFELPSLKYDSPISNKKLFESNIMNLSNYPKVFTLDLSLKLANNNWNNSLKTLEEQWTTPSKIKPMNLIFQEAFNLPQKLSFFLSKTGQALKNAGINALSSVISNKLNEQLNLFGDSEIGQTIGGIFSQGVSSAANTMGNNLMKGVSLTEGLGRNVGSSVAGATAGLAAQGIGKGISSLGGDSMLSRGVGQGVATGLGIVGGETLSNLVAGKGATNTLFDSIKALKGAKGAAQAAGGLSKAAAIGNIAGLAGSVVGTGLQAALGPSKEYGGKYGSITQGMDTAYDLVQMGAGFIPGVGTAISGAMALNKGLSNIFGSTDGMTKTDAILGSAFMPAPIKWLNMAGASTTGTFDNQSWQNLLKADSFMGNAFGNLGDKFRQAREEAGKTYGTFSQGAKNDALKNIIFANQAWNLILAMANLNEYLNIRSLVMSSINNLRYAQAIQGGWTPLARGKYGMKILNNATNHNIGMRLLSGAALIDNKQMILCNVPD